MFTSPPFWRAPSGSTPPLMGLPLPYVMDFNYSDKATMLAAYAAIGITVQPLTEGAITDSGVLLLLGNYGIDTGEGNIPLESLPTGVKSKYIFGNFLGSSSDLTFKISMPPGTQTRTIRFDLWKNTGNEMLMDIEYTDTTVSTHLFPLDFTRRPFSRAITIPEVPPTGTVYVKSFTVRAVGGLGFRWALDNILISP